MTRWLSLLIILLGVCCIAEAGEITLQMALASKGKVVWVDARSSKQFDAGHIPGAVLLNEENWNKMLPALLDVWSPESRVIVYCDSNSCESSQAIADRLKNEAGLERVSVLVGGWQAWQAHIRKL